jgi:hypothetical protein
VQHATACVKGQIPTLLANLWFAQMQPVLDNRDNNFHIFLKTKLIKIVIILLENIDTTFDLTVVFNQGNLQLLLVL